MITKLHQSTNAKYDLSLGYFSNIWAHLSFCPLSQNMTKLNTFNLGRTYKIVTFCEFSAFGIQVILSRIILYSKRSESPISQGEYWVNIQIRKW